MQICAQQQQMVLIYDYFYNNLEKEYQKRRDKQQRWSEAELLYILDSVVNALLGMKTEYGELDMESIMIDDRNRVLIMDRSLLV